MLPDQKRKLMKTKKLVIFGSTLQAEVAHFLFQEDSEYEVEAFTVQKSFKDKEELFGKPIMNFEEIKEFYPPERFDLFVALGYSQMNNLRHDFVKKAKDMGYTCPSYISSKATTFSDFNCGENCLILEDNTIQPFVKIGNNVTLWSGNHIGHHSKIEDNSFITSHCVISGSCTIGRNSFLGVNCTINDKTTIAPYSLLASGSLITKDTEEAGIYIGSPAKKNENKKSIDIKISN